MIDDKGFRTLFDLAADAMFILDMDGFIKQINPIAHDRLGYTSAEMVGKHIGSFILPEFAAKLGYRFETVQKEGFSIYQSAQVRKDGTVLPVEVCTREVELAGQRVIFSIVRDITERKKAEELLRFHSEILNSVAEGIFLVRPGDGLIVYTNPRFERMFGYQPAELIGKHVSILNAPSEISPEAMANRINQELERSGVWDGEVKNIRKNGTVFWCHVSIATFDHPELGKVWVAAHYDDTAREEALSALKQSEKWMRSIFENVHTGIASTDMSGRVTSFNDTFRTMLGYDAESLMQMNFADFTHPDDFKLEKVYFDEILAGTRNHYHMTKRYMANHGNILWVDLSAAAVRNAEGKVTNFVAVIQDITERKIAENEIEHLAFYDPLTQLPNRRLLLDRLKQALASSARSGREGALLFIDLDNFKNLNDTLGHDIGDTLLQQVKQRLESCIRNGDTVARLGGDEFVVMLSDLSEQPIEAAAQTESIGEKILATLSESYQLGKHLYRCTASIGVTLFSGNQQKTDDLMKQADIAMYQAKKAGRNTLRFFDRQMQENISARVSLEGELHNAIEFQQFHLHYQIQVDNSLRPLGAEALIRWLHPARGLVLPAQFIPLAEETGLILPVGLWVLETACAQIKAWEQNARTRELTLAVNVSAKQFRQADFVDQVRGAVHRHAIKSRLLKLELTESLLQENIEVTIATMNALSDIGVQFSLDDFGTGYSSLQYLKRLPLDQLKIDQSFVSDIATNNSDKAVVRATIAMARSLGLDVIAEGVDTEEQRRLLLKNGCTQYQGYLFGRPVPIEQFEALLN